MFNLFSDHVNSDFDFLKKSKLLVCLSGGVDSMVLIDLLRRLNYDVSVAHCNFKLRGDESDLDEKFVKKYCYDNSIQFFSKSFHTKLPNHSLQMAARTLFLKPFLHVGDVSNVSDKPDKIYRYSQRNRLKGRQQTIYGNTCTYMRKM